MKSFLFVGANVRGFWFVGMSVSNWFVAVQDRTIHFLENIRGGKDNPRNPQTSPTIDDDSTVSSAETQYRPVRIVEPAMN